MLRRLPQTRDPNLLVGAATSDDAGVYQVGRDCALIQTVDFFTPIVDDPYAYGQIAAANALSDVYAMGGRPLTAMALLGVPTDKVAPQVIRSILRGGAAKVKQAGCSLVGGHTIKNPEPIYGLSVTGIAHPKHVTSNAAARAGDLLVLTKPLGTGIATTGIKCGFASASLARKAIEIMRQLNTAGAELAERGLVKSATDVTGFGLLGHLASMCRASGVGAELVAADVPTLAPEVFELIEKDCVPGGSRSNLKAAEPLVRWQGTKASHQILLSDAQTSGGLLLCVPPRKLSAVREVLKRNRTPCAAVVGEVAQSKQARIVVR